MRVMRCHSSTARGRTKAVSVKKRERLFWTSECPPANLCFSLTKAEIKLVANIMGRKQGASERGKFQYGTHVSKINTRNDDEETTNAKAKAALPPQNKVH